MYGKLTLPFSCHRRVSHRGLAVTILHRFSTNALYQNPSRAVHLYVPVKKHHIYEQGIYFITFTCHKWIPLFEIASAYYLVYKWFDYLTDNNHHILAYVIMPNHLHVMILFANDKKSINTIIGNGKRFIAYGIIEQLKQMNNILLLSTLAKDVSASDAKRGKLHEVFEHSFDIKRCDSLKFIYQKLDYIHDNPVVRKWELVADRAQYPHSSARFYDTREHNYPVTHIENVMYDWISL